jgi:hypothetical protein
VADERRTSSRSLTPPVARSPSLAQMRRRRRGRRRAGHNPRILCALVTGMQCSAHTDLVGSPRPVLPNMAARYQRGVHRPGDLRDRPTAQWAG